MGELKIQDKNKNYHDSEKEQTTSGRENRQRICTAKPTRVISTYSGISASNLVFDLIGSKIK